MTAAKNSNNSCKPFLQGHFDRLCSLYAIIHALQHSSQSFRDRVFRRKCLFDTLAHELSHRGLLAKAVTYGVEIDDLSALLDLGCRWGHRHLGVTFSVSRPFKGKWSAKPGALLAAVESHFQRPNTAAIVLIQGNLDHWSCIQGFDGRRLTLIDSYDLRYFSDTMFRAKRSGVSNPRHPIPDSLHLIHATPAVSFRREHLDGRQAS